MFFKEVDMLIEIMPRKRYEKQLSNFVTEDRIKHFLLQLTRANNSKEYVSTMY